MSTRQAGFTIIELIVVIALIGILAAVALPKYISVQENAKIAAVQGTGAGFSTGVALFRAQVVANGTLGVPTADVSGYGDEILDANEKGYPVGTADDDTIDNAGDCIAVWEQLFQGGHATVSTEAGKADYLVEASSGTCTFSYEPKANSKMSISYNSRSGDVDVDADPDA